MKRILKISIFCICILFALSLPAFADENKLFEDELNSLSDALDSDSREIISEMGIDSTNYKEFLSFNISKTFKAFSRSFKSRVTLPLTSAIKITLTALLCCAVLCFEDKQTALTKSTRLCAVLCTAIIIVVPISTFISEVANLLSVAGAFIFSAVPVYAGLLSLSGQSVSASSYSYTTLIAGNIISAVANYAAEPMLNIFLALSVVSGISESFSLSDLCAFFAKAIKIVLTFCMTIFGAILGVQSIVSSNIEVVTLKTAKFAASAFVPAVGSAIGDAMASIYSSVRLLRSGAGAFGILAAFAMFVPSIFYCTAWKCVCALCASICKMLGISQISTILKAAEKTVDIIFALLISTMVIIIVLSAVVLSARGNV